LRNCHAPYADLLVRRKQRIAKLGAGDTRRAMSIACPYAAKAEMAVTKNTTNTSRRLIMSA